MTCRSALIGATVMGCEIAPFVLPLSTFTTDERRAIWPKMLPQPPLFSTSTTILLSTAYTTAYLSSIYLLPSTRITLTTPSPPRAPTQPLASNPLATAPTPDASEEKGRDLRPRDRNHPSVIKARLTAVSLATTASLATFPFLVPGASRADLLRLLGLSLPPSVGDAARLVVLPLGLTASLFAGSIYIVGLRGGLPFQAGNRWWSELKEDYFSWVGARNYLIGPLTEELVFRAAIISVSYLSGMNKRGLVLLTPLYFGIAHVHHAWEFYVAHGRTKHALKMGIAQSMFQFAYTTLFGWYSSFLFIRTGSIIPPFLCHTFCNTMGLPPIAEALRYHPDKKLSIYGSYFLGIGGFIYGFWRWTDPSWFGGSLYWS